MDVRTRVWRATAAIGAAILFLPVPIASGQAPENASGAVEPDRSCVSASLSPDHWTLASIRRLEALGLIAVPPQRAISACRAGAALRAARAAAEDRVPGVLPLIEGWDERLRREFPGLDAGSTGLRLQGSSLSAAYLVRRGAGAPGLGEFPPERTGVLPLRDRAGVEAVGDIHLAVGSRLALRATPGLSSEGARWRTLDVIGRVGDFTLAGGRGFVGYGFAPGGGIVLSGDVAFERVQVESAQPLRLPGLFGAVGPISGSSYLGRIRDDRHTRRPAFWGGTVSFVPHPRTTFAIHRAAMFGGEGQDKPVSVPNLLNMLIGRVKGVGFEDQIVSVELRYRLPTEAIFPLTAYMEWGAEDAAGAWWDVPGRIAGVLIPAIPGLPQLAVGGEYSSFGGSCCNNPPWYRHWAFEGSWALEDRPLGHPLGGEGSELLLYGELDLPHRPLRIAARSFRRHRGPENLYVPGREGGSFGIAADFSWKPWDWHEVQTTVLSEAGSAWSERRFDLRFIFYPSF